MGDCDGNGEVAVNELVSGVNILLGTMGVDRCPSADANSDGMVLVNELVDAVGDALNGCPSTPTPTSTPTNTATPTINHTPMAKCLDVYRTYPFYPIELPIEASDPDGGELRYVADKLPPGAQLDELTGVFTWTPNPDQLGPFYVPFTVSDSGNPPLSARGQLVFRVSPHDTCVLPDCDPATGCTSTLPSVDENCCIATEVPRVAEPLADCPEGRVLYIGRNARNGFGRVQNCDHYRVHNNAQIGAVVRMHIETRCFAVNEPLILQARLETASRLVFEENPTIRLRPRGDGFAERIAVEFDVRPPAPFFDLAEAEANLRVMLTDLDGTVMTHSVRVILTFDPDIEDLPDVDDEGPIPPFVICNSAG